MIDSLLWLAAEPPDPRSGGGGIRQAGLLTEIARRVPVDLVVAGHDPADEVAAAVRHVVRIDGWGRASRAARIWSAARGVVLPRSLPEVDAVAATHSRFEAAIAKVPPPDATVVTHLPLAPLLTRVPGLRVFHPFHVESEQLRDLAGLTGGAKAWRLRRYAANAVRLQRWAVKAADLTVVVSDDDARLLSAGVPSADIVVAPNAVAPERYAELGPPPAHPIVLFPASLDYAPNVDAAVWLAREVWPVVRRRLPEARLVLAGREPAAAVRAVSNLGGVELHADVPDMVPWLGKARVVVVPMRFGTGTRLKALEAMAAGRPVVGTEIGLAGLGIVDGVHARVTATDADALATAIAETLESDVDSLVTAARRLVSERYTWSVVADSLLAAIERRVQER